MRLEGIDFSGVLVPQGNQKWQFVEFSEPYIALEGQNGSGKSTLLRGVESIIERDIQYKGYQSNFSRPGLIISINWQEFVENSQTADPFFSGFWNRYIDKFRPEEYTLEIAKEEIA